MNRIPQLLQRFRADERGSIAVETVIIIPVLFWAYLAMFTIFDAYRQHSVSQKATFTIGDIISRETQPLDIDYLNGTRDLLAYLTVNVESEVAVRITSVKYDAVNKLYERDWSKNDGWMPEFNDAQVAALKNNLPVLPDNERVMVVETFVKYAPAFNIGLSEREIHNFVFTRSRYTPRVCWEVCP